MNAVPKKLDRRKATRNGALPSDETITWLRVREISWSVLLRADTTTIRIILANASIFWAVVLCYDRGVFARPEYYLMSEFFNQYLWAAVFFAHAVGVYWRLFDPRSRPWWGVAVNLLGFIIWTSSTMALNASTGYLSPTAALEWTLCLASAWALWRTGVGDEVVTP